MITAGAAGNGNGNVAFNVDANPNQTQRTGTLTTPYAEAGGFAKTRPDVAVPDVQLHFVPAILEDHGRQSVRGVGYSIHVCVLRPESRGTVRLGRATMRAQPR